MKLLVVTQYFWPENFRINDLVVDMVARGHEVTVLTGQPNYPSGKFFEGYGWRQLKTETYHGAKIIRVPLYPRGSANPLRLALNYLSFIIFGTLGVWTRLKGEFDAIFVFEVSPVTVGIPAIFASKRFKAPLYFWVLDLWPESIEAAGGIRSPLIIKPVEQMVRWIYERCTRILVASRAFIPEITRHGISHEKITYFPNWGENLFQPLTAPDPNKIPRLPDGFKILFAGNIGESQDFPTILDAAEQLRDRPDIRWIIVGDGRAAEWAKNEAKYRCLPMSFLGQYPIETMPHFYAAADAFLLPLKRQKIFALTIPGKLQSYLACERPVIAMLDGEGARIIEQAEAGLTCPAGNATALASRIQELVDMPQELREKMGKNGRKYYERNFDRNHLFNLLEELLRKKEGWHE